MKNLRLQVAEQFASLQQHQFDLADLAIGERCAKVAARKRAQALTYYRENRARCIARQSAYNREHRADHARRMREYRAARKRAA